MTLIVGVTLGREVWMGGDSVGVGGEAVSIVAGPKVFKRGSYLLGHSTTFRLGNLLRYSGDLPEPPTEEECPDIASWVTNGFVDSIRKILKEGGHAQKSEEQECGGFFMVGVRDRLFSINPDYGFIESADNYACIGSGDSYAMGALAAMKTLGILDPKILIKTALTATAKHCNSVGAPFTILCLNPPVCEE
jgi:hypothetical protein